MAILAAAFIASFFFMLLLTPVWIYFTVRDWGGLISKQRESNKREIQRIIKNLRTNYYDAAPCWFSKKELKGLLKAIENEPDSAELRRKLNYYMVKQAEVDAKRRNILN